VEVAEAKPVETVGSEKLAKSWESAKSAGQEPPAAPLLSQPTSQTRAPIYGIFIGGKWVAAGTGQTFPNENPAKPSEILGFFQKANESDVRSAIDAAEAAFPKWADTPVPARGKILLRAAQLIGDMKEELAKTITLEMGKTLKEARADVQEAIDYFEYFAGEGRRLLGYTTTSELPEKFAMAIRRPIGVVGIITPWNFPIAIPSLKIAPALICGNTIVFKPSSDTPLCGIRLVQILERAGIPPGVVNLVTGSGDTAGGELVRNKKVRAVSFTGHRDTGAWILQNAGIKRVGLELGGKNAIIVMDDADLKLAVEGIVWAAFATTGQRCSAASRVIVHEKIRRKLEKSLIKKTRALKIGSGLDPEVNMGPLVNPAALEKTTRYIQIGQQEGAKMICGGKPLAIDGGYFYEPTIFTKASPEMKIAREEIFGPVTSIIPAKDLEDAIRIANSVEYGLVSSIFTKDVSSAMKAVMKLESGITYVNAPTVGAEAHLPWGGVKASGDGWREGGITGIDEFTEWKTVYVDYSGKLQKAQIDIPKY